ncbi:MAG TPA: hypothetical protein VGM57_02190 [Pseudolabrys sp.]
MNKRAIEFTLMIVLNTSTDGSEAEPTEYSMLDTMRAANMLPSAPGMALRKTPATCSERTISKFSGVRPGLAAAPLAMLLMNSCLRNALQHRLVISLNQATVHSPAASRSTPHVRGTSTY